MGTIVLLSVNTTQVCNGTCNGRASVGRLYSVAANEPKACARRIRTALVRRPGLSCCAYPTTLQSVEPDEGLPR
jgi:hypothetical protein